MVCRAPSTQVKTRSMHGYGLALGLNNVVLVSIILNNVELASMNNVELASIILNNVELTSMNNVVNNVVQS